MYESVLCWDVEHRCHRLEMENTKEARLVEVRMGVELWTHLHLRWDTKRMAKRHATRR